MLYAGVPHPNIIGTINEWRILLSCLFKTQQDAEERASGRWFLTTRGYECWYGTIPEIMTDLNEAYARANYLQTHFPELIYTVNEYS